MSIIGVLAATASLAIILLGLPAQIIRNYREKTCEGVVPSLVYSITVAYILWAIYGWVKPDWFLVVSQTPGCILSLFLLFQMFYYRKKDK